MGYINVTQAELFDVTQKNHTVYIDVVGATGEVRVDNEDGTEDESTSLMFTIASTHGDIATATLLTGVLRHWMENKNTVSIEVNRDGQFEILNEVTGEIVNARSEEEV